MAAAKLTPQELEAGLAELQGWTVVNGKLHREYKFPDFSHAFGFMAAAATGIERMNHHPEWFNVWNKVVIDLNTHSVQGISNLDFQLAEKINEIFGS